MQKKYKTQQNINCWDMKAQVGTVPPVVESDTLLFGFPAVFQIL